ncbi:hypothetical protein HMPREF9123_1096 [Neisseria bacilliformis ATCC BAA-1200]|jgi:hypothetical protein|uniref:Uncharacterized protein n=1 Tax=Neisseria bacilliformis ATCC BAA-1200 TaxID=888742 RepID=F2BBJ1_9NEIS|nr:hypothetical protein [Neisseria bacilliformis]EGF11290.1 hypothetical protein HMPREF9123_1096 [Neisseria bacilliformis ATCC BAA-1200]QMT48179.1 hypothetical protein H3L91_03410 [Neisseria bacilliformis]
MTQFKFGDRVQDTEGRQFVFLRDYLSSCTVASSDGKTHDYLLNKICPCATEPHPDTERLDWLADRDNHIGNVQLPAECVACNLHSLRDAIDMAMRMQPENAETQEEAV